MSCHYMNDSQRGTVLGESIIHWPPRFAAGGRLSATVAQRGASAIRWIERLHGPTYPGE